MTSKELAYFEDAVNHESNIISIISNTIENLEDEDLVNYFNEELEIHNNLKVKLLKLLEVKCNE